MQVSTHTTTRIRNGAAPTPTPQASAARGETIADRTPRLLEVLTTAFQRSRRGEAVGAQTLNIVTTGETPPPRVPSPAPHDETSATPVPRGVCANDAKR